MESHRGTRGTGGQRHFGRRVIEARSQDETAVLGRLLGGAARRGDVIALSGPLGAGKTYLAQAVARGMGVIEPVPSPTFNLLLVHAGEPPMFHFDLYRLERASQLEDIDFYETLESGGVAVIEWADRFPEELPDDRLDVGIEPTGVDARRLTLMPTGTHSIRLAKTVVEAWEHAMERGVEER